MRRIFQVAAICFVLIICTPVGYACFCIKPEVKDAYERARVVFVGEVVEVIPPRVSFQNAKFEDAAHIIKFKIEKAWKQTFWTEVSVLAGMNSCFSLRRTPRKGEKYLVYAEPVYRDDPSRAELMTNGCTRTALLSEISSEGIYYRNQAEEDIRLLNNFMFMIAPPSKPGFDSWWLKFG